MKCHRQDLGLGWNVQDIFPLLLSAEGKRLPWDIKTDWFHLESFSGLRALTVETDKAWIYSSSTVKGHCQDEVTHHKRVSFSWSETWAPPAGRQSRVHLVVCSEGAWACRLFPEIWEQRNSCYLQLLYRCCLSSLTLFSFLFEKGEVQKKQEDGSLCASWRNPNPTSWSLFLTAGCNETCADKWEVMLVTLTFFTWVKVQTVTGIAPCLLTLPLEAQTWHPGFDFSHQITGGQENSGLFVL